MTPRAVFDQIDLDLVRVFQAVTSLLAAVGAGLRRRCARRGDALLVRSGTGMVLKALVAGQPGRQLWHDGRHQATPWHALAAPGA